MSDQQHITWLAEVYRIFAGEIERYIVSKVYDASLAEDLNSIVFLKALRWLKEDQHNERVRAWLSATARTTISDHWQDQKPHLEQSLAQLENQLLAVAQNRTDTQQQAETRVQHLLSLLSERERTILTLRYLQGYSAVEIAKTIGTSAGHIRVLQLRALRHAAQLETQERQVLAMEEIPSLESFAPFLTPESSKVLDLAREEARMLTHKFVGTEHLLLGLLREGSLSALFTTLNISYERIRGGIVFIYDRQSQWSERKNPDPPPTEESPAVFRLLTPRSRQVIVLADDEAKSQGEQHIHPEHLFLALMREGGGIGFGLLRSSGLHLEHVYVALADPEHAEKANYTCSFCGRKRGQAQRIFHSDFNTPGRDATPPPSFICDVCVTEFYKTLQQA